MLNRSVEILKTYDFDDDKRWRLEDFDYGNREMSSLFFELLNETEFMGLSVWKYKIPFFMFLDYVFCVSTVPQFNFNIVEAPFNFVFTLMSVLYDDVQMDH